MDNAKRRLDLSAAALRLARQRLAAPCSREEYPALFRALSPVQTRYWCRPGQAPELMARADFDDLSYNDLRRASRQIVKGRFMGGNIAYADIRDLELLACAYRRPLPVLSTVEAQVLDVVRHEGPLTVRQMKESTGLLVKTVSPALKKLQEAFWVFEDQTDGEWDRAFYLFQSEFPDIDLTRYARAEAIRLLLPNFLRMNVVCGEREIRSFFGFPAADVKQALAFLTRSGEAVRLEEGMYALAEDARTLAHADLSPGRRVYMLNRNDFLVRSNEAALRERFAHPDWDVLYYLLIDGFFSGAVVGKFKFGPDILADVLLSLPEAERKARRDEILDAVYAVYDREQSPLARYDGKGLTV